MKKAVQERDVTFHYSGKYKIIGELLKKLQPVCELTTNRRLGQIKTKDLPLVIYIMWNVQFLTNSNNSYYEILIKEKISVRLHLN